MCGVSGAGGGNLNTTEWIEKVHALARQKGWWEGEVVLGEKFALVHAELSEALEALREPTVDAVCGKCEDWNGRGGLDCPKCGGTGQALGGSRFLEELADTQIRLMDIAGHLGVDFSRKIDSLRGTAATVWEFAPPKNIADGIDHTHQVVCEASRQSKLYATCGAVYYPEPEFARVFAWVEQVAMMAGCNDLEPVIAAKHLYNQRRPYRHGGKAL